jgi:hypothetical protein
MSEKVKGDRQSVSAGSPPQSLHREKGHPTPTDASEMGSESKSRTEAASAAQAESVSGVESPVVVETGPGIPVPGAALRVDGSHGEISPGVMEDDHAGRTAVASQAALESAPPSASAFENRPTEKEVELLLQASQIAEHLRTQFGELDRREQGLNEQLTLLDQERRNVRLWVQQQEEQLQEREDGLQTQEAEFGQKVVACKKLVSDLEEQEQAILRIHDDLAAERAGMKEVLQHEIEVERVALQHSQKAIEAERGQLKEQTEHHCHVHAVALQELEQQKLEQEHTLGELREELERELDAQRLQLKQQRSIFDNRIRFQQEHLQKSRQELETVQRELRVDQQQAQLREEHRDTLLRLRSVQLDHARLLIEERENSIEREQQLLAKARRAFENESQKDRDHLRNERETWDQERQSQHAEIRRQQDMLTLHAENLEGRRARLDQLRAELEETHRNTLEMRMAVEEAWAQLSQAAGGQVAKQRVDEAREALSEHYRHLREALSQQRQEIVEAQTLFQRQKDEFRDERQTLTEWVAERDEKLRLREEEVGREAAALDSRDVVWRDVRDRWMQEKIEAEQIIRDLLKQLDVLNDPNSIE